MIETGDLAHLYSGDQRCPNGNGDFMQQGMELTDVILLHKKNRVSPQSTELNSLQAQMHEGAIPSMSNEHRARNDTDRNERRHVIATTKPSKQDIGINIGDRIYKCDLCGYNTKHASKLETHKRIHNGEKPYKCDICSYRATRRGHVTRHKLIHSGDKPYTCDLCDYGCTTA